jgi:hypothetical protein
MDRMTHRPPKHPLALRIIAAGCVVLWLAGISACSLEALFCCDSHEKAEAFEHRHERDAEHAHGEAYQPHDAGDKSQSSHKDASNENSCCSTLKAVVQTMKPIAFSKPALPLITFLCVLQETHAVSVALSENLSNRQAKPRDWVFTPEVCLGPAHRSLAPPSLA